MELQFLKESQLKAQLRLDDDVWAADLPVIEIYAQAAEDAALEFIARDISEFQHEDEEGNIVTEVPTNIVLACLHRFTDSYTHRDPNQIISRKDVVAPIPAAMWQDILKPYIKPCTL